MDYTNYSKEEWHRPEAAVGMITKTKGICVDLGCYRCSLKAVLPRGFSYIGVDVKDRKGNVDIVCNIDKELPIESNSVDLVVAIGVVEHLLYPNKFMEEITRICKDNGEIIISLPNNGSLLTRLKYLFKKIDTIEEQRYGHHWTFSVQTGKLFVEKYFKIVSCISYFSYRLQFMHRLKLKGEMFYRCKKKEVEK